MSNNFEVFVKITGEDNFTKAFNKAKQSISKLDNAHKSANSKMQNSNKKTKNSTNKLANAFNKLANSTNTINNSNKQASKSVNKLTNSIAKLVEKTRHLEKAMGRASNKTALMNTAVVSKKDKIEKQSTLFDKAKKSVIGYAKSFFGAYLAVQGAKKGFTDFAYLEKYVKKTQALLHASDADMADYTANIKKHAETSFNTMSDLFESGFFGAKAGINKKEMSDFVRAVDDIQTAIQSQTGETAQEVAQNFAIIRQAFESTSIETLKNQYAKLIDTTSGLNVHELAMGMQKLNMVAKVSGASFASLSTPVALLVQLGQSGANASTSIQNLAKAFTQYGDKGVAKMLGLKQATLEGDGFIDLLNNINDKYGKMTTSQRIKRLKKVFGLEGAITINRILPQLDEVNKKFTDINKNSTGFVDNLLKTVKSGAIADLKGLENATSSLSVAMGELVASIGVVKMLTLAISKLTGFVGFITSLAQSLKTLDITPFEKWNNAFENKLKIANENASQKLKQQLQQEQEQKEQKRMQQEKEKIFASIPQREKELQRSRDEGQYVKSMLNMAVQGVGSKVGAKNVIGIEITNNGAPAKIDKVKTPQGSQIGLVKQDIKNR
jgi:TP901 family phage tail tape measure protein